MLIDQEGHGEVLLGNEAVVRGALEAGVGFAAGYPGTPSSEITDSFARISDQAGIIFEYSVNEKISLEMAFGASQAGVRSICAMKHLGLMVAGDPLSTIPYVGTVGGMVIVSAGDPSCRTSPNEQDQRYLSSMLYIPLLDPKSPQQAQMMTRYAFELSEQSRLPVILRITTRVCHTRGVITYAPLARPREKGFTREPLRLVPIPAIARGLRLELTQKVEAARELLEQAEFNEQSGEGNLAILATGSPADTCDHLLRAMGIQDGLKFMSLGGLYPLPERTLLKFLQGVDQVLVVEELSPYLEDKLQALCAREGLGVRVLGKRSGHFPVEFEYEPATIQQGIYKALGLGEPVAETLAPPEVPLRPPILCAGCAHRAAYYAARAAFGEGQLYFSDIGCYTLGFGPPLNTADAVLSMGSSIPMAAAVSQTTGQRTVAFIGDSTFFHSGMPPLLNAVKEGAEMVLVILDNEATAMTGFQESPTVEVVDAQLHRRVSIEGIVRALGVENAVLVDPYDLPTSIAAFERARDEQGVSVVLVKRPCINFFRRATGRPLNLGPAFRVDHQRCQTCGRSACGMRCEQQTTHGYERHLSRSRSLEGETGPDTGESSAPQPWTLRPEVAPCSSVCPLSLCVQGYVGHIAAGELPEALEMILARNPLADSVCRVCHHPCESTCVRQELDEPVAINDLKRHVMDWAAAQGERSYSPQSEPEHGKTVAIVGAGPSGLAAAHDLRLRGYGVRLLDAGQEPGGLLVSGIPPFRLPREALKRDIDRILGLGVQFKGGVVLGKDLQLSALLQSGVDAVYLAVGAHRGLSLNLEGEKPAPGENPRPAVVDALQYLKAINLNPGGGEINPGEVMMAGVRVVVVGGGNAAIDAARTALRHGAQQVIIAYRRRREEMPAIPSEVEAAEAEGITLLLQHQPVRISRGQDAGLLCVRTEPGEPDASGRRRPVAIEGSETLLAADQIIVAIGQAPEQDLLARDPSLSLECDNWGSVKVEPGTGRTSHPQIFAGGDLVDGERTVTAAMAMGLRAAWAIDRSLRGPELADRLAPPPLPEKVEVPPGPWLQRPDRGTPRRRPAELAAEDRLDSSDEVVQSLDAAAARAEAARCLACGKCGNCRSCIDLFGCPAFFLEEDGRPQIDPALCTSCGVCAALCPNGAIRPLE